MLKHAVRLAVFVYCLSVPKAYWAVDVTWLRVHRIWHIYMVRWARMRRGNKTQLSSLSHFCVFESEKENYDFVLVPFDISSVTKLFYGLGKQLIYAVHAN